MVEVAAPEFFKRIWTRYWVLAATEPLEQETVSVLVSVKVPEQSNVPASQVKDEDVQISKSAEPVLHDKSLSLELPNIRLKRDPFAALYAQVSWVASLIVLVAAGSCIWVMGKERSGDPSPASTTTSVCQLPPLGL